MKITPRVFSGMQPTGSLHLGNSLGAMVNWIKMQDTHECIYCVVDLHAITVWQDPEELKTSIRLVTAAYMAAGLDPKKSILFNQSQVAEHAELAWVFNCVARLGWLDRMTQFKEKSGKHKERSSVGLYTYPVLQAADILLYKATEVPVGEDQKQHLELTRDIAAKFNNDFSAPGFFPLPDPVILFQRGGELHIRAITLEIEQAVFCISCCEEARCDVLARVFRDHEGIVEATGGIFVVDVMVRGAAGKRHSRGAEEQGAVTVAQGFVGAGHASEIGMDRDD